jgi:hypothetical protein
MDGIANVSRRTFLGAAASGGAALLASGVTGLVGKIVAARTPAEEVWLESRFQSCRR